MKIAHIGDTHIKNLKHHYEYNVVFEQLYQTLRDKKVDYILHCGDLAHTKTQLSPEYFHLASSFLKNLADIAPVHIILGNHDGNLKNLSRLDAISPVVDSLEHPNLHLHVDSGEVELNEQANLNVLSVFDEENWVSPSNRNKINIAMYHGAIRGVCTDVGYVMEHGDHDLEIFEGHDFVLLGDIHKSNQSLDEEGRVRYCGSTIQQNHGETNDKGILIWDIKSKDEFDVEHVVFTNPKPFITVDLTSKGKLPKGTKVPKDARLRLRSRYNLPLATLRKTMDIAKSKFNPESVTFINKASANGAADDTIPGLEQLNMRDKAVQEKLICEYLEDYEVEPELLDKVLQLNAKYNSVVETQEDVTRNIRWKLKRLEFDNLFNYKDGNSIDFGKLQGTVGIFGKNYCGKSSIVDSLLFTMFNSISKNTRKNLNIINQNKQDARGRVEIEVNGKTHVIERTVEKYQKKLNGKETTEAKTDLSYHSECGVTKESTPLNGTTRNETDKNIRKTFGTLEDFLLTTMASQLDALAFIGEGSTRRKEILAKFLDLEIFEAKYKLAKEDAMDTRSALKRLEEVEFAAELSTVEAGIAENEGETASRKKNCNTLQKRIKTAEKRLAEVEAEIKQIPTDIIDISSVRKKLSKKKKELKDLERDNSALVKRVKSEQDYVNKVDEFMATFNIDEYRRKKELIVSKQDTLDELLSSIQALESQISADKRRILLLEEVPCGNSFQHCKFIKDAHSAVSRVDVGTAELQQKAREQKAQEGEIAQLQPDSVERYLDKYLQLEQKKKTAMQNLSSTQLEIANNTTTTVQVNTEVKELQAQMAEYEENREAMKSLETLHKRRDTLTSRIGELTTEEEACQEALRALYSAHGSLVQKHEHIQAQQEELEALREEYSAYDLFKRAMHTNGISYDIIKNRLPIVNNEIAKVLANIVDFEILLATDDSKLDISIKHPSYDPRPLELGSGAEKTLASMAIRLALLKVSSLPLGDIFIMDEPGTALDAENMEGFTRLLELVKSHFKTVILISHLDSLKDCVDVQILVENQDGYACVQH